MKRDSEVSAFVVQKDQFSSREDTIKKLMAVNTVRTSIDNEMTNATTIVQQTARNSLYSTIIGNNNVLDTIRRSIQKSPGITPRSSKFDSKGVVSSVNHLIKAKAEQSTEERIDMASELYLPGRKAAWRCSQNCCQ